MTGTVDIPHRARVLSRAEHPLSRALISPDALKVLYRLHRAGFLAYLVGGAVRDLLLGRTPKDFDVGTNARPSQVRQLFRNSRVIGRRFRLVMVRFAGEVVEVATFRRSPEPPEIENGETADVLAPTQEADEFGTPEEDAWRRDFTVNGLFYDIADFSIVDHVGGLRDLEEGVIRTIGEPGRRFAEDPVRMMRAVEYGARLGFRLERELAETLGTMHAEIRRAAPARIAYELLESLKGGQALPIFRGLAESELLGHVVPEACAGGPAGAAMLWRLLQRADAGLASGKRLSEETLLGLLFLPTLMEALSDGGAGRPPAEVERMVRERLDGATLRLALSHHRSHLLRSAFLLLARLMAPPRSAKAVLRTVKHEAFPVAWDLGHLLANTEDRLGRMLAPWEGAVARVQAGLSPELGAAKADGRPRVRRRRRGGRRRPAAAGSAG